jgi:hypothetical protein
MKKIHYLKIILTMFMRALRYTRALSRWIKAGRPARSEEEIKTIFNQHCDSCTERDHRFGRCNLCGCHVGLETAPILNKIAMKTEACPDGKW